MNDQENMSISNHPRTTWAGLVAFAASLVCGVAVAERPNVILIVTDDQGYGDMACHGNPALQTPHLDRLYRQSTRLQDYHVEPVCTPTRASLMTGRYCTRVGAWSVTEGRQLLHKDEVTMAEVFAKSGYRTGMFGKWHLGDAWPYAPRFRGFQDVVCHRAGGIDEIGNPAGNDFFDDTYYRNGIKDQIDGYCTDVFFRECERFILADAVKPFFVYLPLNAMHGPHTVAETYSEPFRAKGFPEKLSKFYGMIINFDENLGRLLDLLKSQTLDQDTIVIFMGDNGTAAGRTGSPFNAGMRGTKGSCYEGGHRVACFVRWSGRLRAGRQVEHLTSCRDWLPTLISLCELEPPDIEFDGADISPLLTGKTTDWPERTLFVQRQGDRPTTELSPGKGKYPHYSVLTERWRLVDTQLFEIQKDPGQKHDVASDHPDVARQLTGEFRRHFQNVFGDEIEYARFQLGMEQENPTRFNVRDWHPTDGNVIWKKEQLDDDSLAINGFWAVEVRVTGKYAIRLSRFPDDSPGSMRCDRARLKVGAAEVTRALDPQDTSVTFEVDLPAGDAKIQSWLRDAKTGKIRGSYYVEVEQLSRP